MAQQFNILSGVAQLPEQKPLSDYYKPTSAAEMLNLAGAAVNNKINQIKLRDVIRQTGMEQKTREALIGGATTQQMMQINPEYAMNMENQEYQNKMGFYLPQIQAAINSGDNEIAQRISQSMKADPLIRKKLGDFASIEVTSPNESTTVLNYSEEMLKQLADDPKNKNIRNALLASKPGWLEIKTKKGQGIEVKPFTPPDKSRIEITRGRLTESLGHSPSDSELDKELERQDKEKEANKEIQIETRMEGLRRGRISQAFDTKLNHVRTVSQGEIEDNPTRFVSPQDANYKSFVDNSEFETANRRFVSMIDENIKTADEILKKYGINKNAKALNMPINKISTDVMGSADINSLGVVLTSIINETGKVESGSLGIAGVEKNQFENYQKYLNINNPVSSLLDTAGYIQKLGKNRISTITKEKHRLLRELGSETIGKDNDTGRQQKDESAPTLNDYLKGKGF